MSANQIVQNFLSGENFPKWKCAFRPNQENSIAHEIMSLRRVLHFPFFQPCDFLDYIIMTKVFY